MISRYEQKEITQIWSEENKFKTFLEVELAICEALETTGTIPKGTSKEIKKHAQIDVKRIHELDAVLKHDIIAFCTSITENLPAKSSKFFHYGVTSSDIIDSSLTLQIKASLEIILKEFKGLNKALLSRANEMKGVFTIGRSHGMHAEPMSFGVKLLGHYNELARRLMDLESFHENELTIQCSGAVGNFTIIPPEIEKDIAKRLSVHVEPLSTQVIPRDRVAKLVQINALTASAIERFCVEIRHLHHSDINELHEGFSKGQKGSSIMPHKKNPISSENLSGIARVIKSHAQIALENNILWHERDISHSSSERLYLPDNLGLLLYSIRRLKTTVENLVFHREEIESKVTNNATYLSSYYLHEILKQTDDHREEIYKIVQKASFATHESDQKSSPRELFFDVLTEELKNIGLEHIKLNSPNLEEIKSIYLKSEDYIFKKSLESYHP